MFNVRGLGGGKAGSIEWPSSLRVDFEDVFLRRRLKLKVFLRWRVGISGSEGKERLAAAVAGTSDMNVLRFVSFRGGIGGCKDRARAGPETKLVAGLLGVDRWRWKE
jgi:hypothetical protein